MLTITTTLCGHRDAVLALDKTYALGSSPLLLSGSEDTMARIWDLRTSRSVKAVTGLMEPITSVQFSRQAQSPFLFYVASGTEVYEYDMRQTNAILCSATSSFGPSAEGINQIALSQNGKYMAIADDSGIPKVFDMHTRKPTQRRFRKKHSNLCMCVAFCCHFSTDLWTGGMDACQYQWDFTRALPMAKWAGQSMAATAASGGAIPMFNPPFVYSLAVHPNGRQVVAGLGTGAIRVLQWQSLPTPAPAPPVSSASKQPKGKSAKHKKPASTKPEEGWVEQLWLQDGHSYTVSALDYANDTGSYLVSGGLDGKLAIWEPNTPTASGEAPSEGSEAAVAAPFRLQKTAPTVFDKVECLVVVGPDPSENTGCQTTAAKADVTDQLGALSLGSARDSIIAVGGTAPGTNFSGRIALYQLQC